MAPSERGESDASPTRVREASRYPDRVVGPTSSGTGDGTQPGLSRALVALMAVATGAVVANLYYAQPVLHEVAHDFHSGPGATSSIITATQIGYAAGLLLVVPLGDLHPRRALVTRLFCVAAVALVACAARSQPLVLRHRLDRRGRPPRWPDRS